jgi:NADPH:quinone reductase-like Zn-dependent oxidoreductase
MKKEVPETNFNKKSYMKAVLYTKSGSEGSIEIQEIEKPIPKENEILIKVHATTVTSGDVSVRSFKNQTIFWLIMRIMYGVKRPDKLILGSELAGKIEATGENVSRFNIGDKVFASTGMKFGANAEYITISEDEAVALMPDNLTFEEAASIPFGANAALFFLRKGSIQSGQKVLINGASGSVGTFAVQIANYFGAEVTGVCSTNNLELVKSLGADNVIDYTKEDFTESGIMYDLIFDVAGKTTLSKCKKVLTPNGKFVSTKKGLARETAENLLFIKDLIERNKLKPIIDKRYSLSQITEAHQYVEDGNKKGNVVITL